MPRKINIRKIANLRIHYFTTEDFTLVYILFLPIPFIKRFITFFLDVKFVTIERPFDFNQFVS